MPEFADVLAGKFDLLPIELPECPIFLVTAVPCGPDVTGSHLRMPAGRGLSRRAAMVSAAGESIELMHSLARNADGSRAVFPKSAGPALVPMQNLVNGATAMIAAQEIYLDWAAEFSEPLICEADSSGCAAGRNFADTMERALLECVERDACAAWWYGRQSRQHVSLSVLRGAAPRLMWWLETRARQTHLIDIRSDIDIAVLAAVSAEADGRAVAIGTAAGKTSQDAAVSAVTEMVQTELALQAGRNPQNLELETWLGQASLKAMPQFSPLGLLQRLPDGSGRPMVQMLAERGFEVLGYQFVPDNGGLTTVRCLVPGFSAMHGRFNASRILQLGCQNPHYGAATSAEAFETLEPY